MGNISNAVASWNKIQKQLKNAIKTYPQIKLKQMSVIFIFIHINNFYSS